MIHWKKILLLVALLLLFIFVAAVALTRRADARPAPTREARWKPGEAKPN
jgi:hypothetical protein